MFLQILVEIIKNEGLEPSFPLVAMVTLYVAMVTLYVAMVTYFSAIRYRELVMRPSVRGELVSERLGVFFREFQR